MNWRIGDFVVSSFDVTNRLIGKELNVKSRRLDALDLFRLMRGKGVLGSSFRSNVLPNPHSNPQHRHLRGIL